MQRVIPSLRAFSPDGSSLASCSDDRSVVLWRDTSGECAFVPAATLREVHERAIYTIDWARDPAQPGGAGLIATGSSDDAIALMQASVPAAGDGPLGAGSLVALGRTSGAHAGDVNSVAWRPGAPMLASCGDDGCLRLWRVSDADAPGA